MMSYSKDLKTPLCFFDNIEVHPLCQSEDGDWDHCETEKATHWGVFGHYDPKTPYRGIDCIFTCDNQAEAEKLGKSLLDLISGSIKYVAQQTVAKASNPLKGQLCDTPFQAASSFYTQYTNTRKRITIFECFVIDGEANMAHPDIPFSDWSNLTKNDAYNANTFSPKSLS